MNSIDVSKKMNTHSHNRIQSRLNVEIVDGTTYEVTSNYIGDMSILDLFKYMLKRDIERIKP